LAGLLSIEDGDESPEKMLADMERTMAANARMLARTGHLNRKDSPGIRCGKSLMLRPKKEVDINLGNDPGSHVGLGSFGIKAPVLEHFRRITDTDTQYRLALLREEVMGQLAKTAAVAMEE